MLPKCNKHLGCFSSNYKLKSCVQLHWRPESAVEINVEVQNYGVQLLCQPMPNCFVSFWRGSRKLRFTTRLLFSRRGFSVCDVSKTQRTVTEFQCVTSSIPKIEKCFYKTSLNGIANCRFHYHFDLFSLHHFIRYWPFLKHLSSASSQQHCVNRKGQYPKGWVHSI